MRLTLRWVLMTGLWAFLTIVAVMSSWSSAAPLHVWAAVAGAIVGHRAVGEPQRGPGQGLSLAIGVPMVLFWMTTNVSITLKVSATALVATMISFAHSKFRDRLLTRRNAPK